MCLCLRRQWLRFLKGFALSLSRFGPRENFVGAERRMQGDSTRSDPLELLCWWVRRPVTSDALASNLQCSRVLVAAHRFRVQYPSQKILRHDSAMAPSRMSQWERCWAALSTRPFRRCSSERASLLLKGSSEISLWIAGSVIAFGLPPATSRETICCLMPVLRAWRPAPHRWNGRSWIGTCVPVRLGGCASQGSRV